MYSSHMPYRTFKGTPSEYSRIHKMIQRKLGKPSKCEKCFDTTKSRYHWANISGTYSEDLNDWRRLCVKCHFTLDRKSHEALWRNNGRSRSRPRSKKSHCLKGHLLSGDNLYIKPNGKRNCRQCMRIHRQNHYNRIHKGEE